MCFQSRTKIKCPECGEPLGWFRLLKKDGYEKNGWKLEPMGTCDTCNNAFDYYSYPYATKKECLDNWKWQ